MVRVRISKQDYLDILRWDDDGGAAGEVIYEIIPEAPSPSPSRQEKESGNPPEEAVLMATN